MRDFLRVALEQDDSEITQAPETIEVPGSTPVDPAATAPTATDTSDATSTTDASAEAAVVMKGPLAEVYSQALDIAYAKEEPVASEEGKAALESQANDVMMMKRLAEAVAPVDNIPESHLTVYGVAEQEVTEQTVVDLTKEVAQIEDGKDMVLIIDGTQPGPNGEASSVPTEQIVTMTSALECIVESFGGKVYRSLPEFAAAFKK